MKKILIIISLASMSLSTAINAQVTDDGVNSPDTFPCSRCNKKITERLDSLNVTAKAIDTKLSEHNQITVKKAAVYIDLPDKPRIGLLSHAFTPAGVPEIWTTATGSVQLTKLKSLGNRFCGGIGYRAGRITDAEGYSLTVPGVLGGSKSVKGYIAKSIVCFD